MIELLNFDLPASATATFDVPVSAEPQAIWLESRGQTGGTPLAHRYFMQGAWAGGSQWAQGCQNTNLSISSQPRSITSLAHCLRIHDHSDAVLSVDVVSVSASAIRFNVAGTLLSSTPTVRGLAISGIQNAYAHAQLLSAIPLVFDQAGFQPDFGIISQVGAKPDNTMFQSGNSAIESFGVINPTTQACNSCYYSNTSSNNRAGSRNDSTGWWYGDSGELNRFTGSFTAAGIDFAGTTSTTSSVQTIAVLLLQGMDSSIQTFRTPLTAGTQELNFTFAPEALLLFGSGNSNWDLIQTATGAVPGNWNQQARLFGSPGDPSPTSAGLCSGHATVNRYQYRNNEVALTGIRAGSGVTNFDQQYDVKLASFNAQAAQLSHSLNGTGNPALEAPFGVVALAASSGQQPAGASHHPFGRGPWV